MTTLVLRLAAPMQSWGVEAKFNRRTTNIAPSKSAIIGLVAGALGRKRNEDISDLQRLRFGVRIDQPGVLIRDFHMAYEEAFWRRRDGKYAHVTYRYYLGDAVFLAALSGDATLLEQIDRSLRNPEFPIFLGRRSCPPVGPLSLGLREGKILEDVLRSETWQASEWVKKKSEGTVDLEMLVDALEYSEADYFQRDLPISFDQNHRKFGYRRVARTKAISVVNPMARPRQKTEHDAMHALGEE